MLQLSQNLIWFTHRYYHSAGHFPPECHKTLCLQNCASSGESFMPYNVQIFCLNFVKWWINMCQWNSPLAQRSRALLRNFINTESSFRFNSISLFTELLPTLYRRFGRWSNFFSSMKRLARLPKCCNSVACYVACFGHRFKMVSTHQSPTIGPKSSKSSSASFRDHTIPTCAIHLHYEELFLLKSFWIKLYESPFFESKAYLNFSSLLHLS